VVTECGSEVLENSPCNAQRVDVVIGAEELDRCPHAAEQLGLQFR
jgi:hypothetical protein